MNALLVLVLPLLVPASPAPSAQVELEPAIVQLEQVDGVELWSVRAQRSSPAALLRRIAELSGREVDATTALERAPLISVSLDRRPLSEVLEYALGSAGLRGELAERVLIVRPDLSAEDTPEQCLGAASAAWARAAARFPRHPIAANARLAQGEIDELRGRPDAARARYLDALTLDPASITAPEAYLRAGRIAAERGDWSEASEHFRALANLPAAEEYRAVARVELARATLALGDAKSALHILDSLDEAHPCWDRTEASARALVRIEALLVERRFQDALVELEAGAARFDELTKKRLPRLRARALEGAGLAQEASQAWLLVAREESGPARVQAYQTAAGLCADDPLGVLFVAREAKAAGFGAAVADAEHAARESLGVAAPGADPAPALEARLAQAERWLTRGQLERATPEFDELYRERALLELTPEQHARLVLGQVRCVRESTGLEAAVDVAQAERARTTTREFRRALDVGMAHVFEESAAFERAADAYQGSY